MSWRSHAPTQRTQQCRHGAMCRCGALPPTCAWPDAAAALQRPLPQSYSRCLAQMHKHLLHTGAAAQKRTSHCVPYPTWPHPTQTRPAPQADEGVVCRQDQRFRDVYNVDSCDVVITGIFHQARLLLLGCEGVQQPAS